MIGRMTMRDSLGIQRNHAFALARRLVNYDSADLTRIQGCRSKDIPKRLGHRDFDEAIHRDNLVVL